MEKKLIFGFLPDEERTLAVTYDSDFRTHGVMSYEFTEADLQRFAGWESAGIIEENDSFFVFPQGRKEFVGQYLEYNGVMRDTDFENFLRGL